MSSINNYCRGGSISIDQIEKALGKFTDRVDYMRYVPRDDEVTGTFVSGSVCADQIKAGSIATAEITLEKTNMKNTENPGLYGPRQNRDRLLVDFDEAKWEIDVPGVAASNIEVYTVKDVVTVKVSDTDATFGFERKLQLLEGETIKASKLELGVLTVTIDRPHKKVSFEIA